MTGEFKKAKIRKEINPTSIYLPFVFKVCLLVEITVVGTFIDMTVQECKQIIYARAHA
jgi:hypothetical protein